MRRNKLHKNIILRNNIISSQTKIGNITSFFEKTYESGWTDCIIAHRNGCIGCSTFNNYDDWIKENHPEATHNLFYPWKSQSEKEWSK